uniref:Targeting protein for Xklp2 n=1 Tax=Sipha flava TaxID=143950 RepID=A0A2S2R5H5_9HEMI
MNKEDDIFEFDAPSTFANLYEIANASDDGADKYFDIIAEKMEGAKSEPNLGIIKKSNHDNDDDFENNKENFAPDDQFDDKNINSLAHQLIRSAKKSRTSKLHNRHSITIEGIEVELPRIKHHAMITRLDELENTPKIDLRTRSVIKSGYKYEHIKSGSNVLKSRNLFASAFEPSSSSNNTSNIIDKQINSGHDSNHLQNNQNGNFDIHSSAVKPVKTQKIKVLNSHGGVQVIENKELGHGGIRVLEKQLHTVPKPFSFESRKSCAVKSQNLKNIEPQWTFKARPATVLKRKPFVPKHEKKFTEPKNICLNTERRAQEWMVFEQEIKEKFSHYEELLKKKEEENKMKEMNMIKNMRQQTIHKAEPIKKYKPILIRKSERPVTVPQSPRFSIRPIRSCLNSVCE